MAKTIGITSHNYDRLTRLAGKLQSKDAKNKSPNDAINYLFDNTKGELALDSAS